MNVRYRNQKTQGSRPEGAQHAQAIVEFALVLPILMVMLVGIFEVGRLLFIYTAVTNASREAARFGSALGYDDDGYHKYKDCARHSEYGAEICLFPEPGRCKYYDPVMIMAPVI